MEGNLARIQRWAKRLVGAETMHKKTEITVETDRVLIIRRKRVTRVWCEACAAVVDAVSLEEVASITGSPAVLGPDTPNPAWHLCEAADGSPRICLESVLKSL